MDELTAPVNTDVDDSLLEDAKINSVASSPDIVIATDVKEPASTEKKVDTKDTLSTDQMLSAKLVLLKDNNSKVVKLQDIHDAIVAKESINRLDAENVSLSCEDFLGPRVHLNEFSISNSKINYGYSKQFLENKIAAEKAAIKALKSSIATEGVMEYASSIMNANISKNEVVPVHDNIDKTSKGIYVAVDSNMVNISKMNIPDIKEVINNCSEDLKNSICELINDPSHDRVLAYMCKRVGGMDMRSSIGTAASSSDTESSLDVYFTYLKNYYAEDIEDIESEYEYYKERTTKDIEELESKDVSEFVDKAKSVMHTFKLTEMLEELAVKLPIIVKVVNKVIESVKY